MIICETNKEMDKYFEDVLWRISRKEKEKELENLKGICTGKEVNDYKYFHKYIVMGLMDSEITFEPAQEIAYQYRDLNKLLLEVYEIIEYRELLRKRAEKEKEWQFIEENLASMRIPRTKKRGRPRKYTVDLAQDRAAARLKKRKEEGII